jgi:NADH dehydrogenase FAD-containing subunit
MTTHGQRVVVIGGGYAGVGLARALDDVAQVTLIDLKEGFFHRIASLRASSDPEWTHAPFLPYDGLLDRGQVVFNKAVRIMTEEKEVVLANGEWVPYDVLVVATGADYQEPARFTGRSVQDAARAFTDHQRKVAQARSVLVVGGGPSGVELSAEVRRANPGATVTLAHSGSHLLPVAFSARPGRRAQSWLEAHDVRVLLNTVVASAGGVGTGLRDQAGSPMGADVVFWATGTTPNTLWLRLAGHGSWLDAKGLVKVDPYLRVQGRSDIFAVGDVNDVTEMKVTTSAMAQAEAAAYNIRMYLQRGPRHVNQWRQYRPGPVRVFSVPFGPAAGISVFPVLGRDAALLGDRTTVKLKSKDLYLPSMRQMLRVA